MQVCFTGGRLVFHLLLAQRALPVKQSAQGHRPLMLWPEYLSLQKRSLTILQCTLAGQELAIASTCSSSLISECFDFRLALVSVSAHTPPFHHHDPADLRPDTDTLERPSSTLRTHMLAGIMQTADAQLY